MRVKTLLLLLLVTALCVCQAAVPLNIGGVAALLDDDGSILVGAGAYLRITALDSTGLFAAAREDGKVVLMDETGCAISEGAFSSAAAGNGRLILKRDAGCFLADAQAQALTEEAYSAILPIGKGFFAFKGSLWDDIADELFLLNADGDETASGIKLSYASLNMRCGRAAAMNAENGLIGYLDEGGAWAIPPAFSAAGAFNGGIAAVGLPSGIGLIDLNGDWLLSPLYSDIRVSECFVLCRERETLFVYERTDEGLIMRYLGEGGVGTLAGAYFTVCAEESVYLFDRQGELLEVFDPSALVFPGFGTQLILYEAEGCRLLNVESAQRFGQCESIRCLDENGLYAYVLPAGQGGASYRVGVMDRHGIELSKAQYEEAVSCGGRVVAMLASDEIRICRYDGEKLLDLNAFMYEQ